MHNSGCLSINQIRKTAWVLAVVVVLAQAVIAIHEAVHFSLGDDDHCIVSQISPFFSGQLPTAVAVLPPVEHFKPLLNLGSLPTSLSIERYRRLSIRGPPACV
jgi:hypothetical protein